MKNWFVKFYFHPLAKIYNSIAFLSLLVSYTSFSRSLIIIIIIVVVVVIIIRDFKIQRRDGDKERRLKSEFAIFQSLQRLFPTTYFVKCRRTLLKLNFKGPYSSSEREIKFHRCLFTSSIKREIRHFHVVVVQKRERNVQKSVMQVRSCCFVH